MSEKPIFIIAGGTGGHVFPAFSLTQELTRQGKEVYFICDARGRKYLPENFPAHLYQLPLLPYRGNLFKKGLFFLSLLFSSVMMWIRMILKRPAFVVGFGGYPTFAGVLAGVFSLRPLYLHEQNAHVGQTNRFFTRFAKKLMISTPSVRGLSHSLEKKTSYVGMPVRLEIEERGRRPYQPSEKDSPFHLLVLGGSQGAKLLAEQVVEALILLPKPLQKRVYLTLQCRAEDEIILRKKLFSFVGYSTLRPFFENIPILLEEAHLVISRSGASSLAEVATAGRPCLFVPYPYAKDDHQTANAKLCIEIGGAWMIQEKDLCPQGIAEMLIRFMNHPEALLFASEQILKLSSRGAAKKLAEVILESASK